MFESILIANRGAIARRIARTLRRMQVRSVAVMTAADSQSIHLAEADVVVALEREAGDAAYASADAILAAARRTGVQAIHPGYGFLSEDAAFAERCEREGFKFIGPTPAQIRAFGLKHTARAHARLQGLPLVPGSPLLKSWEHARSEADRLGYPVLLKRTSGGGGQGLRLCAGELALEEAYQLAAAPRPQAEYYLERYISPARHLEVQLFGDSHGHIVTLGERDCSLQRRHQKIVEETPAPALDDDVRNALQAAAKRLVSGVGYGSAGTAEFLYEPERQQFYFLEFNPRLQVEHGVTEAVWQVDLVEWMVRQAAGELDLANWPGAPRGVAIQARVSAEDPARQFRPCPGRLTEVSWPDDAGIRIETTVRAGSEVPAAYDPLLAKFIAHGENRQAATQQLISALEEVRLHGCETNVRFLRAVLAHPEFTAAAWTTRWIELLRFEDPRIEVEEPGHETTVQDWPGRVGYWHVGVPPSGPMDPVSMQLANHLVGNTPTAAALECTLRGPTLRFTTPAVVAIVGAEIALELDGRHVPMGVAVAVAAGSTLRLGDLRGAGCRTYLAITNGFDAPAYLGSRSTFPSGRLGGPAGRALRAGDVLRVAADRAIGEQRPSEPVAAAPFTSKWSLAVLLGPQAAPDYFRPEDLQALLQATWRVQAQSSRLGVRLEGPKPCFARANGGEAGLHPSNVHDNPYTIGAVNFTGDTAVILTCDGPSLGGFVCPFTVVQAEAWKLGQLRSGDEIQFVVTTHGQARAAMREQRAALGAGDWPPAVEPARTEVAAESAVLVEVPAAGSRPLTRYRCAGDTAVLVEYGDERLNLEHRFRVHALMTCLGKGTRVPVAELAPGVSTLLVRYDPETVDRKALLEHLIAVEAELPDASTLTVASRRICLPLAFDASTTRAAIERYSRSVRPEAPWLPSNIDYVRRLNGLESPAEVAERLCRASYLVLGLGDVFLGSPCAVALDPRDRLVSTKYNPARTWTPEGEVGLGGIYLCVYGMESPGGYQLVGRTLPVWSTYPSDGDHPWRLRPFDRIEFFLVSEAELDERRLALGCGRGGWNVEAGEFSVVAYRRMLEPEEESIAAFRAHQLLRYQQGTREDLALPVGQSIPSATGLTESPHGRPVYAPLSGVVSAWRVSLGDWVEAGQPLVVVEAMKLETSVVAPSGGRVTQISKTPGGAVALGEPLLWLAGREGD